jgi:DNA-binding transcriptional regulator GbsR (MarR family)
VTSNAAAASARDGAAVTRFIETFASLLIEAGVPRMPARVFVALLATDSGRLTAAELAEVLQVSPAAVSGAVRYLTQVNLVSRTRDPGTRRDHYLVHDDVWYEMLVDRDQQMARWRRSLRDGVDALGEGSRAGRRMTETLAFFEFIEEELPAMLARWRERRSRLRDHRPAEPATRRAAGRTPARRPTHP